VKKNGLILLFVSAVLFLFFFRLGDRPLWSSDEGRYGEIAREMAESRDFIVPAFNYVDFLEKPVMASWLSALAIEVMGSNGLAVRFPLALAAVLGVFMTGWFVRRFCGERTALLAMMFQTTCLGYVLVGRFAVIDTLLTFFLSGAFFCLFAGYQAQKKSYYWAAYAFIGAAFLTKGLLGVVLPGGVMLAFLLWEKRLGEIKKMSLIPGALIFSVIILPWLWQMLQREPEFFHVFFVEHHFSRFSGGELGRTRPFWFYAPILLAIALPWSLFMPAAFQSAVKSSTTEKLRRFAFCWAVVTFIFFSSSRGKLPYYILPVSVPLSVLFACLFSDLFAGQIKPTTAKLLHYGWKFLYGALLLAIPAFNIFILFWGNLIEGSALIRPFLWIASAGSLVLLGVSLKFYLAKQLAKALWLIAAVPYLILTLIVFAMESLSPMQSTAAMAQEMLKQDEPGSLMTIYASPDHFSDLPFHLQRRISVVGTDRGTLERGSREQERLHGKGDWFIAKDEFARRFNLAEQKIFLLVDEGEHYSEMMGIGLVSPKIVKREFGKVLIVNR